MSYLQIIIAAFVYGLVIGMIGFITYILLGFCLHELFKLIKTWFGIDN